MVEGGIRVEGRRAGGRESFIILLLEELRGKGIARGLFLVGASRQEMDRVKPLTTSHCLYGAEKRKG